MKAIICFVFIDDYCYQHPRRKPYFIPFELQIVFLLFFASHFHDLDCFHKKAICVYLIHDHLFKDIFQDWFAIIIQVDLLRGGYFFQSKYFLLFSFVTIVTNTQEESLTLFHLRYKYFVVLFFESQEEDWYHCDRKKGFIGKWF